MTQEFAGEPGELYLVGLLAEHAEEEERTREVLEWVEKMTQKKLRKGLDISGEMRYNIRGMKPRFTQVKKSFWAEVKRSKYSGWKANRANP